MANTNVYDLSALVTNTKASTVYAAHESSLYLPGGIIPIVSVGAGSITAQVPSLAEGSAAEVESGSFANDDFTANAVTGSAQNITASVYAARTILRDAGGVDPMEVGRVLGNSVAKKFDQGVTALFNDFTTGNGSNAAVTGTGTSNALKVADMFKAAASLRGSGVQEQLTAVLHPEQVYALMGDLNSSSFAASDAQNEAMRNGFVGTIAGINVYQSSYVTADESASDHLWEGIVFGGDAMRLAIFNNVQVEVQRRASAVGNDVVASLTAGAGVVDYGRGVQVKSTGFTVET